LHQTWAFESGVPFLVKKFRAAQVHGIPFVGWSATTITDTSAAYFQFLNAQGKEQTALARILYFIRMTACTHPSCKVRVMCRVQWFTRTKVGDGYEFTMKPTSVMNRTHWFVDLKDALAISVAALPTIIDNSVGIRHEEGVRRRALNGPFDMFEINRKAWM
jgi:hypothetical protein